MEKIVRRFRKQRDGQERLKKEEKRRGERTKGRRTKVDHWQLAVGQSEE